MLVPENVLKNANHHYMQIKFQDFVWMPAQQLLMCTTIIMQLKSVSLSVYTQHLLRKKHSSVCKTVRMGSMVI